MEKSTLLTSGDLFQEFQRYLKSFASATMPIEPVGLAIFRDSTSGICRCLSLRAFHLFDANMRRWCDRPKLRYDGKSEKRKNQ
jgi:hypothetical protein